MISFILPSGSARGETPLPRRQPTTRAWGLAMKKLTLNLDALTVASFETAQRTRENGTGQNQYSEGWSDMSVCPTTFPSDCRRCY